MKCPSDFSRENNLVRKCQDPGLDAAHGSSTNDVGIPACLTQPDDLRMLTAEAVWGTSMAEILESDSVIFWGGRLPELRCLLRGLSLQRAGARCFLASLRDFSLGRPKLSCFGEFQSRSISSAV